VKGGDVEWMLHVLNRESSEFGVTVELHADDILDLRW
jgi:hypothetical protein